MINAIEIDFALDAVRRASALVRSVQAELVSPGLTKSDKSPVTVGDFAAQALVAHLLKKSLPADVLVGEEEASDLRTQTAFVEKITHFVGREIPGISHDGVCDLIDQGLGEPTERFWTLDPIDGTKGFLRGGQYAVALALIVEGRVRLGLLGCPNLAADGSETMGGDGCLMIAQAGKGTWSASMFAHQKLESPFEPPGSASSKESAPASKSPWRRMSVSDRRDPAQARLLRSVESGHTNEGQMGDVVAALGAVADPVCMDSQAKYAVLAGGKGELLFRLLSADKPNYREKIWDQAAGSLVVEEAGGRVTDLDGKPLDFSRGRTLANNRGVLASNGLLHDAALAALRKVGA